MEDRNKCCFSRTNVSGKPSPVTEVPFYVLHGSLLWRDYKQQTFSHGAIAQFCSTHDEIQTRKPNTTTTLHWLTVSSDDRQPGRQRRTRTYLLATEAEWNIGIKFRVSEYLFADGNLEYSNSSIGATCTHQTPSNRGMRQVFSFSFPFSSSKLW